MPRRTVPITAIVERANAMLATPDSTLRLRGVEPDESDAMTPEQAFRTGITALLESLLFQTDNYHGFAYTDEAAGDTDSTRRRYS